MLELVHLFKCCLLLILIRYPEERRGYPPPGPPRGGLPPREAEHRRLDSHRRPYPEDWERDPYSVDPRDRDVERKRRWSPEPGRDYPQKRSLLDYPEERPPPLPRGRSPPPRGYSPERYGDEGYGEKHPLLAREPHPDLRGPPSLLGPDRRKISPERGEFDKPRPLLGSAALPHRDYRPREFSPERREFDGKPRPLLGAPLPLHRELSTDLKEYRDKPRPLLDALPPRVDRREFSPERREFDKPQPLLGSALSRVDGREFDKPRPLLGTAEYDGKPRPLLGAVLPHVDRREYDGKPRPLLGTAEYADKPQPLLDAALLREFRDSRHEAEPRYAGTRNNGPDDNRRDLHHRSTTAGLSQHSKYEQSRPQARSADEDSIEECYELSAAELQAMGREDEPRSGSNQRPPTLPQPLMGGKPEVSIEAVGKRDESLLASRPDNTAYMYMHLKNALSTLAEK